jgi:hypothetical protein
MPISDTPTTLRDLVESISVHVSASSEFRRFQRTYRNDRVAFAFDCLPAYRNTITEYQMEILSYFDEGYSRVAVRGPHGLGKTFLASILTHHTILTAEEDCKVPTTASAWRQLEKYLWPEIHKLSKAINWQNIGRPPYDPQRELMKLSLRLSEGIVEAFAVASDDHTTIEGAHATTLFYIFDEAKAIPRPTWNAAEGAFSSEGIEQVRVKQDNFKAIVEDQPGLFLYQTDENAQENLTIYKVPQETYIGEEQYAHSYADKNNAYESMDNEHGNAYAEHSSTYIEEQLDTSETRNNAAMPAAHPPALSAQRAQNARLSTKAQSAISAQRDSRGVTRTIINTEQSMLAHAYAFAISTPGEPSGQFYDIHAHAVGYEDWKTRHVTVDEAIKAGRISSKWVMQRERQWGIDSSIFLNRVLGEFADVSEEGIIPLSWIRMANDRWIIWNKTRESIAGARVLGCDIARGGEDKTVLAARDGKAVVQVHVFSKLPTTQTAGNIKRIHAGRYVNIEMDGGLGAAVYDMLREESVANLRPITVAAPTAWKDRSHELNFENVRAAMWWNMRELLDPNNDEEIMLPPIKELQLDLSTPKWFTSRHGTIQIESKESIGKRIGRSTDFGDAVCLAFWKGSSGGGVVF